MRPSCHKLISPIYYWLLKSHITEDETALEAGLFAEQNKCLCPVVYLYECVCVMNGVRMCMYLSVNDIDI